MGEKDVLTGDEINELLKGVHGNEILEKESAISWDGRNLIIRIPKEVADYLKLTEQNRMKKSFKFLIDVKDGQTTKCFDIVERTKLVRKDKNVSNKKTKKNNKSR